MRKVMTSLLAAALMLGGCGGAQDTGGGNGKGGGGGGKGGGGGDADTPEAKGNPSSDLLPRPLLFGNPDKAGPQISPDGKHISFLAAVDGVLNVWVAPIGKIDEAKPVTAEKERPIGQYFWAINGKQILYLQDAGGDENWHVYAVDVSGGKTTDLTPLPKVNAQIFGVSHKQPDVIVVGLNDRVAMLHDLYTVNLATGERKLLLQNPGLAQILIDDNYKVRLGLVPTPDGAMQILRYAGPNKDPKAEWQPFQAVGTEDALTTGPAGFDATGKTLYMLDSRGRDTAALTTVDLATGKAKVIAQNDKADAGQIIAHPTTNKIQAVGFEYDRDQWVFLDPAVKADFDKLGKISPGDINIVSKTLDDKVWLVAFVVDDGPVRYYAYDRKAKKESFLFTNRKELEGKQLAKMHPVVIKARDGLDLVSYLSLPPGADPDGDGKPDKAIPMVLDVHGGPWYRDSWGYNPEHQLLANRGYAVLSVNYRGSTGFGKGFINASTKEWAGKMHDDLIDAVNWAVDQKIAIKDKVAIYGGSYGGYATLVGLTFTPDVFACGVDIVGPSNMITLMEHMPEYWLPMAPLIKQRWGDWTTEEGRKFLESRSPLFKADKIIRPLLIGQGANDPRVNQGESDQIVKAMQKHKIPVTYILYSDEGHGFHRPPNRLSFYAAAEAFLSAHLGGTYLPASADEFKGTTMKVITGAKGVPGLSALQSELALVK